MYDIDILKSGLQKYVRRNMPTKALFCLRDLLIHAEKARRITTWKSILSRIVIIANEDISIGDVSTVAHVMKVVSTIKSNIFPGVKIAWKELSPLIVMMCEAEKTREFAHIYYALYAKGTEPDIDFKTCLINKDIRSIQWFRFLSEKNTCSEHSTCIEQHRPCCAQDCLDILERYQVNNDELAELYLVSKCLIGSIKENIWIFGLLFLMYLNNINTYKEKTLVVDDEPWTDMSEWIVDDFVIDKHTKLGLCPGAAELLLGRLNGKTLKDFVHEGAISKFTTREYKELHDKLYG